MEALITARFSPGADGPEKVLAFRREVLFNARAPNPFAGLPGGRRPSLLFPACPNPMATFPDSPTPAIPATPASRHALLAYAGPFFLFVLLQALPGLVRPAMPAATTPLWQSSPELWVYPLQTLLCAVLLCCYRREYPPARLPTSVGIFGAVVGLIVFALWVSPQAIFHAAPRLEGGFDPTKLLRATDPNGNALYWGTLALRFARLVVVVPILEEIFWRGFLRYLVKEDFLSVPFGTYTPMSFGVVTAGFMLEHARADWPAALLTGMLYNLVAIRTKSLPACILAHAVTNALLGGYVMYTRQWGFW